MKFSTRTTYGLRAMIQLAQLSKNGSVPLSVVAEKEKLSIKYLERLFSRLKKAGLIKAEIGAGGGYRLARKTQATNVREIIEALEGDISLFHCIGKGGEIQCNKGCGCEVAMVLGNVQNAVINSLNKIKLSDLL